MNRRIAVPALLITPLLLILLVLFLPTGSGKTETVFIPRGTSFAKAWQLMEDKGLSVSRWRFRAAYILNARLSGSLRPGLYELALPASPYRLARMLCTGDVARLTVPEGWTQREIAQVLKRKLGPSAYLDGLQEKTPDYEGRLFPATYRLDSGSARAVIKKMLDTFQKRTEKLKPTDQEIILASMIQKEGARVSEFPRISGVFHNRLKAGMLLESDPTLQYIVGKIRLTREILLNKSPYNSYLHRGLPPGPICNPGMEALKAAQNPEKHDYYFFVAKNDGTHYFSRDKREHFEAVKFYQLGQKTGFVPSPQ